jgi:uncharacterized protein with GYD domain
MSLYLQLVKFTPKGAQALLQHGFEARRAEVARILDENGLGTLKEFWFVADGDWHVVSVVEDDATHAYGAHSQLQQAATGTVENVRTMRIAEGADIEASPALDWDALKVHLG